ncbi:MAG: hypothetical protein JO296_16285 [Pseudonocardiales bacterium]|nr:hypothetical protein [Pseudonocardiales bacterium]
MEELAVVVEVHAQLVGGHGFAGVCAFDVGTDFIQCPVDKHAGFLDRAVWVVDEGALDPLPFRAQTSDIVQQPDPLGIGIGSGLSTELVRGLGRLSWLWSGFVCGPFGCAWRREVWGGGFVGALDGFGGAERAGVLDWMQFWS